MAKLDNYLSNDNYVIIEGIGGMGKSELAKYYAWKYRNKYDIIQFITYSKSLLSTVSMSLRLQDFDNKKILYYQENFPKEEIMQHIFEDKLTCLQQYDNRTLIIIDNYNVPADDNFHRFVSGEYKVIFTSREKHEENIIELKSMDNENDLLELFCEYYKPVKLDTKEENIVREIIKLVQGHTMTVMLIASAMRVNKVMPKDMLELLKDSFDTELEKVIAINKEEISVNVREQVMYQHILNLFDIERLSKDEEEKSNLNFIMANMAILPYTGMDKKTFLKWASDKEKSANSDELDKLIKLRWVQFDEETQLVFLHPIISDVAWRKLDVNSEKCLGIILYYIKSSKFGDHKSYSYLTFMEKIRCIEMMELACKRIKDETEVAADLFSNYGNIFFSLTQYKTALDFYFKVSLIYEKIFGKDDINTALTYNEIADIYTVLEDYTKALEWHQKSLNIFEKVDREHPNIPEVYKRIADVYYYQKNYQRALELYQKSLTVSEDLYDNEIPVLDNRFNDGAHYSYMNCGEYEEEIADTLNSMASVYKSQGDYLKALEVLNKSLAIRKDIFSDIHPIVADSYNRIASVYEKQEIYPKALENYFIALDIYKSVFINEHPECTETYDGIAYVYFMQKDYKKALEWFQRSISLNEKVLGKEHPETILKYNNIATIYGKLEDYLNAWEWYQKAIAGIEKAPFKKYPFTDAIYNGCSFVCTQLGKHEKAQEYMLKAK